MKLNHTIDLEIIPILQSNYKIAVVVSDYYDEIANNLVIGVEQIFKEFQNIQIEKFIVSGSFELPIVCQNILKKNNFDAAIALGVVVQGETRHFDYVCEGVMSGLMRVMLDTNKVIGFGVLTVNDLNQAKKRAELKKTFATSSNKGVEVAISVIKALKAIEKIHS